MTTGFDNGELKNFKTIIIGKASVGKSTLLLRYVEGQFNPQKPTIGIDYRFKKVSYEGVPFNLELWDSAGQQRYRTIVYNYFNLSKAACIVFDITSEDSLNDAKMWLQQLVLHCGNDIPKVLIGNKLDLLEPNKRQQQLERLKPIIQKIQQEYNCQFFSVSAYTGQNISQPFQYLIKQLYKLNQISCANNSPIKKQGFKLNPIDDKISSKKKQKQKCC